MGIGIFAVILKFLGLSPTKLGILGHPPKNWEYWELSQQNLEYWGNPNLPQKDWSVGVTQKTPHWANFPRWGLRILGWDWNFGLNHAALSLTQQQ